MSLETYENISLINYVSFFKHSEQKIVLISQTEIQLQFFEVTQEQCQTVYDKQELKGAYRCANVWLRLSSEHN